MSNLIIIDKQAAIDALLTLGFHWDDEFSDVEKEELDYAIHGLIMAYKDRIEQLPSVQPIIRCRDCISYQEGIDIDGKPFTRCNGSVRTYGHTLPDWYCADAEKRTEV